VAHRVTQRDTSAENAAIASGRRPEATLKETAEVSLEKSTFGEKSDSWPVHGSSREDALPVLGRHARRHSAYDHEQRCLVPRAGWRQEEAVEVARGRVRGGVLVPTRRRPFWTACCVFCSGVCWPGCKSLVTGMQLWRHFRGVVVTAGALKDGQKQCRAGLSVGAVSSPTAAPLQFGRHPASPFTGRHLLGRERQRHERRRERRGEVCGGRRRNKSQRRRSSIIRPSDGVDRPIFGIATFYLQPV
jgi:hypothetical protein